MIIDTSAVLAVLLGEPDAEHYEKTIASALPRRMSVVGLLEAAIVLESRVGRQPLTNWTCFCKQRKLNWQGSRWNRPRQRDAPGGVSARETIRPG